MCPSVHCSTIYNSQDTDATSMSINRGMKEEEVVHIYAAATAATSLQSCPTLCSPMDGSPPGPPVPGILQARTLEWVAISFSSA